MCQDTKWDKETVLRPYASFLRLAYETIILRQYIRNLLFDVLESPLIFPILLLINHLLNHRLLVCRNRSVAISRLYILTNLIYDIHAIRHISKHGIIIVQEFTILMYDKKLRTCAVRITGASHRDSPSRVRQVIIHTIAGKLPFDCLFCSAGAIASMKVAQVANLKQAIDRLKEAGFWVAGASEHAKDTLWKANLKGKMVLVMGNEGEGLARLTQENCDFFVTLPQFGKTASLNVAQASTALMYEWLRQNYDD